MFARSAFSFWGAGKVGPETVWHYGHGLGIGTGGTPRALCL
jgi:hypothetical protein